MRGKGRGDRGDWEEREEGRGKKGEGREWPTSLITLGRLYAEDNFMLGERIRHPPLSLSLC